MARGERWAGVGPGEWTLALEPSDHGWDVAVLRTDETFDRVRIVPRFGIRPTEIDGWHFRNADNTGPNAPGPGNVNAPGRIRDFEYGVARASGDTVFGGGRIAIEELELGNLDGERAWIERMRFAAVLCPPGARP